VNVPEVLADGPAASAAIIRNVLDDRPGPARRLVLANAAAALFAAGAVPTLRAGVERADEAIRSGKPRQVLVDLARGERN
jgi:anthranilate phosphoribosyltransferase